MYSTIINPKTGRKVSIDGTLGRSILRNYMFSLRGGYIGPDLQSMVDDGSITNKDAHDMMGIKLEENKLTPDLIHYDVTLNDASISNSMRNARYNLINNAGAGNCGYFSILCGLSRSRNSQVHLHRLNTLCGTTYSNWDSANPAKNHDLVKKLKLALLNLSGKCDNQTCRAVDTSIRSDLTTDLVYMNTITARLMAFAFGVNVITQCACGGDPSVPDGRRWEGARSDGNYPSLRMDVDPGYAFMATFGHPNAETIWILNHPIGVHYQAIDWH